MITLENHHIKISIADKGAELQSLYSKETQINYLWDANPKYWAKYSPVLFPIVGALKNNSYQYNGQSYSLPRHGFARDMVFKVNQISDTEAEFTLAQNTETLKVYPFYFELKLIYKLIDAKLKLTYQVLNKDKNTLPFSLGAHPAFAVPHTPNTQYEDYYLSFNEDEQLVAYTLKDGLVTPQHHTIRLSRHNLKLNPALFYHDALVFKAVQSNCISLLNGKNHHGLHFHFEDFPFLGIWAATDAPFVCIEPWCGIADSTFHNQDINYKEGINHLLPNQTWTRFWEVECF